MAGVGFTGPPAVDFYSMLSGLGDTIAKNRTDQAKRDAFAAATTPGPDGKIDYGKAILGLAQVDPQAATLLASRQNHEDTIKQQAIDSARAAANDTFNHSIASANLKISQANLANNSEGPEEVTAQRINAAKTIGLQPGSPEYTQYIANGSIPESSSGKPVPFETLSGTKFLVKQPGGGYTTVDPAALAAPVPSSARVVGDAEGVASGLYAPPNAPGQRPPIQGSPQGMPQAQPQAAADPVPSSAPATFGDRFASASPQSVAPTAAASGSSTPLQQPAQTADLNAVDPGTGRRENWLKSQPPDVQAYIKKVADYEIDPRTTSIKGGHREQVMSAVAQYDPTYDQNTFGSRAKSIRDFATGSQGNSIRSFDVAVDHLDTLQKYVTAMKSGNIPLLNKLRNAWEQETGSSLPTNVQAVAPIVGAEVSKAIIGSNNALADREELRQPLQGARSPEQLSGAIEAYKSLMTGQLKGLGKQYEDTTGKKNFSTRLRPNTLKVLMGDQEGATAQGNSTQPNKTSNGVGWSIE